MDVFTVPMLNFIEFTKYLLFGSLVLWCILGFQIVPKVLKSPLAWAFNWKKFFLDNIYTPLSNFSYCLLGIVLKFHNLLFSNIDLFYSIFTVICLCFKRGWCKRRFFYVFLKLSFLKSKSHVLHPLLIVVRALKFLEGILISTTITSSKQDENKAGD